MLVGAAEDAVQQSTTSPAPRRKLDLLALAGFDAVRDHASLGAGASGADAGRADALATSSTQAASWTGIRVYVAVINAGSKTTPLTGHDQQRLRRVRGRDRPRATRRSATSSSATSRTSTASGCRSSTRRRGRRGARLRARCSRTTYDALKAVSPDVDVIGGALSPRGGDKPGTARATRTRRRSSSSTSARRTGRAAATTPIMDAFAIHPYEDNSSLPPTVPAPEDDDDRDRRLRQARHAARRGVRRHGAARLDAADRLRRVRRRDADPGRRRRALYTGHRAGDHEAGRRGDAGDVLPPGAGDRVLPAERARRSSSSTRSTSRTSTAGSPASTTRTARRRRASPAVRRGARPRSAA